MGPGAAAHLRRGRVRGLGEGRLGRLRAGVQGAPRPLEDVARHQVLAEPARRRQVSGPGRGRRRVAGAGDGVRGFRAVFSPPGWLERSEGKPGAGPGREPPAEGRGAWFAELRAQVRAPGGARVFPGLVRGR